ncbi:hypothetical protein KAU33_10555 [Candidatus Dependentiae bacterium]|nr:hypothetical protein [Candidatus Dependentiae bacterium]
MKFKIKKQMFQGSFQVNLKLVDWTSEDDEKSATFGPPMVEVLVHTNPTRISVKYLKNVSSAVFDNIDDADKYVDTLKKRLKAVKERWENLTDEWSSEETI